ncbi:MAG: 50S ribosomal protein L6 [Candidatus Omnitrophica bacterium]|nr:50S ribosomal protein L6 [Candidatus Omnitrophota bacterium]
MSRVGKKPITIPGGIKISLDKGIIAIEGKQGKLDYKIPDPIKVEVKDNQVIVTTPDDQKRNMSLHGLVRTLISNMIKGVSEGYKKELEIRGVGYKAQIDGAMLKISLGFSHPVEYQIPEGITVEAPKPTILHIKGIDKVKVGAVAAEIRDYCKPEPYKGKGVRYMGEYVRHKAGKTVA